MRMSQDDLDAVRRGFEAMNAGREQAARLVHPEFEMVTTAEYAAEPDTYSGADGVRRWFAGFDGVMDDVSFELRGLEDAGKGRVIVEFTLSARGTSTGLEAAQEAVAVAFLRDRRIARLEFHTDVEAARASLS